jgi:hypothetical protein
MDLIVPMLDTISPYFSSYALVTSFLTILSAFTKIVFGSNIERNSRPYKFEGNLV